MKDIMHSYNNL